MPPPWSVRAYTAAILRLFTTLASKAGLRLGAVVLYAARTAICQPQRSRHAMVGAEFIPSSQSSEHFSCRNIAPGPFASQLAAGLAAFNS